VKRPAALVGLLLAVAIAASAVVLLDHEGSPLFAAQQQNLHPVSASALQRLILTTRDPRPGAGGRALSARCTAAGTSALGNPWRCVVRYPHPPSLVFALTVRANYSIYGSTRPRRGQAPTPVTVTGCCVQAQ
jgi:hypothetical protein